MIFKTYYKEYLLFYTIEYGASSLYCVPKNTIVIDKEDFNPWGIIDRNNMIQQCSLTGTSCYINVDITFYTHKISYYDKRNIEEKFEEIINAKSNV